MTPLKRRTYHAAVIWSASIVLCHAVAAQVHSDALLNKTAEQAQQAQVAFFHSLLRLDGSHLKVTIVEVRYGPGESSPSLQSSLSGDRIGCRRRGSRTGEGPARDRQQSRR